MPFLPPNQQRQSTEGISSINATVMIIILSAITHTHLHFNIHRTDSASQWQHNWKSTLVVQFAIRWPYNLVTRIQSATMLLVTNKPLSGEPTELYILLESILQLEQRKILRPSNGRLASPSKMAALRPVFDRLPEPNRAWLLVVYFSR